MYAETDYLETGRHCLRISNADLRAKAQPKTKPARDVKSKNGAGINIAAHKKKD